MTINAEALKDLRKRKGLSQEKLAEECSQPGLIISPKAIYRYEKGETKPSRKKAQRLAEFFGTTVAKLNEKPQDPAVSEAWLRDQGYVRVSAWLSPDVVQNYRLVRHHYGVSATDLIDAAPWIFTLLAEESLADRKQRLADAETAFGQGMGRLPDHLGHRDLAYTYMEEVCADEEASIASRDIFGKKVLEAQLSRPTSSDVPAFDPDLTNPFVDFLCRKASEIASVEINAGASDIGPRDLPTWSIFTAWLDELAGGDWLAKHAIKSGHAKFNAIPPELQGAEKRAERVAWLIDQIPANERERLVHEHEEHEEREREFFADLFGEPQ